MRCRASPDSCTPWLQESCPPATRLACGVTLLWPVPSREEGYVGVSSLLPFSLDADARDFTYQINRRKDSRVLSGVRINRLSKWSVLGIRASLMAADTMQVLEEQEEEFAIQLELDVNTVEGDVDALSGEEAAQEFDELVTLAREIAGHGDRR